MILVKKPTVNRKSITDVIQQTIKLDDIKLIDKRDVLVICYSTYLLNMDGVLLIKRLQRLPSGTILVNRNNPIYRTSLEIRLYSMAFSVDIIKYRHWRMGRKKILNEMYLLAFYLLEIKSHLISISYL